jgi:hypothetical protein
MTKLPFSTFPQGTACEATAKVTMLMGYKKRKANVARFVIHNQSIVNFKGGSDGRFSFFVFNPTRGP